MNIGCTCDSNMCAICVETNSCIKSMPLVNAYFPLVADESGYERTVATDFFYNVHTSTQTEELFKV